MVFRAQKQLAEAKALLKAAEVREVDAQVCQLACITQDWKTTREAASLQLMANQSCQATQQEQASR